MYKKVCKNCEESDWIDYSKQNPKQKSMWCQLNKRRRKVMPSQKACKYFILDYDLSGALEKALKIMKSNLDGFKNRKSSQTT